MKIDYKKERQILKKIITTNEISSLININNTTIKDITVLGIGGSHIYKANCKNLNIEKYTFYEIDEGNFFENIQNFIKEEKEFNTIFSYPFIPKKNNGYIDAFFKNNTVISKKLPFKKEDFLLSYKLNRLTNIVNDACASNLFNIYTNKGYEIYLSLLSGTGINISYSQNNSPINTEFGNIKIPKESDLLQIPGVESYENILSFDSIQKSPLDLKSAKDLSAHIFSLSAISLIEDYKSASLIFQGSFITKDKEYSLMIEKYIKQYFKGNINIIIDNFSDIKGASLI